ncbi:hypothetical protein [uncultured Methylobacterium sp.]|jgi:hypothetical protein|uniref:hypothetical protein n=1 Tax=uncultured Methylobacterium sp. TaxID=157278 RepID=UPI002625A689|nr:hypothetical protein [uncultured Methylobacterium sp.]
MVDRNKLQASKPEAQAAKDAFAAQYARDRDDLAVGLGLNSTGDDWALTVFARTPTAAQALPDHDGNFAVEVRVTGRAKAY